jgi:hypothetical protein
MMPASWQGWCLSKERSPCFARYFSYHRRAFWLAQVLHPKLSIASFLPITLEPGFCSCLDACCIGIRITSTLSQNARVLCAPDLGGFDSFSWSALPYSLFIGKPILDFSKFMLRNVSPVALPSESLSQYCGRDKGMPMGWSFNWVNIAARNEWKPRGAL